MRNPSAAMRAIYQFIGEPWFEHDFGKLAFSADEFDARVGMPGLHSVRPWSRSIAPRFCRAKSLRASSNESF
jgi:hypothetical protein